MSRKKQEFMRLGRNCRVSGAQCPARARDAAISDTECLRNSSSGIRNLNSDSFVKKIIYYIEGKVSSSG